MKKTIAILIAALMLLSMIPMNVFAADEDVCKVPAGAEHTKDNCAAYTLVEVIDPVDCKMGYTLYSCDKCETVFADDFTWNPDGGHVWETKEAAKPATCSAPAYKELQVCKVCGTKHPELNGEAVEGSKPVVGVDAEHTWNTPDIEDCIVADVEFTCTKCGATKTEKYDSHDYKDYPDAFVAPTCDADGTASFNCKRCDHVKTIVFKTEGHNKVTIPADPFVDCTKPGATAGEKCTICGKVFTAPVAGTPKDCKWVLKSTITPATCDTDGKGEYECSVCHATKEDIIPKAHKYGDEPNHTSPATCTAWGFDFYYCTVCGYLKPFEDADKHAPLGHVTYEEADVKATTGADTCEEGGALVKTWTCNRPETKNGVPTTCGATCTETIDVYKAHDIKTVVVPAYCHQVGFTVDYCANPDCAIDAVSTIKVGDVTLDLSFAVEGLTELQLVPGKDAADKAHNGVYAVGTTLDANKHNLKSHVINDSTCFTLGAQYYYCPNCSYQSEVVEIPMKKHTFDYEGAPSDITDANCTDDAIYEYTCTVVGCGAKDYVTQKNTNLGGHKFTVSVPAQPSSCTAEGWNAHKACSVCDATQGKIVDPIDEHVYVKVVVEPQCDGTKGSIDYKCVCGKRQDDKTPATVTEYEYDALRTYNSWDEAKKIHPGIAANGTVIREGDCTKTGLISYSCSCGKAVLVNVLVNPLTGKEYAQHHYTKDPQTPQVNPTCQKGGTGAIWNCTVCNTPKGGEPLDKVGHDMKPSPCGDGTYCGFGCGEKTGAGYVEHNIVTVEKYKDATCTTIAFVHTYCTKCDTENKTIEFMRYYAPALGHDYKKVEGYDSTCEATGLTDGTQCSRCDAWGTEQEPIAKKDHVNKDGVKLYDKCTDTTKDRDCTICKKTIGTTHNNAVDTIVKADCNSEGYTLYVCVDCKEKTMSDFVAIDPNHAWKEVDRQDATVLAEGWVKYECTVCKADGMAEYTKVETLPILTQIDIVLNATNAAETAGETFTDSSLVALTITLDSAKLSAWGVSFDLYYSENLQFVSAEFSAENKFSAIDKDNAIVNNNFDEKNNNLPDYVSISAIAPNTEDKKTQDVALEGKMEFVTLYFKVVNGDFNDVAYAEFYVANALIIDTKGEDKTTSSKVEVIELTKFMDYNGDNVVTIEDVLAATKIVSGELTKKNDKNEDVAVTYDVALDVDKDGEITYADLLAILNYINGAKSYADVTA